MSAKLKDLVEVARAFNADGLAESFKKLSDAEDALEAKKQSAQELLNSAEDTLANIEQARRTALEDRENADISIAALAEHTRALESDKRSHQQAVEAFEAEKAAELDKLRGKLNTAKDREKEANLKIESAIDREAEAEAAKAENIKQAIEIVKNAGFSVT